MTTSDYQMIRDMERLNKWDRRFLELASLIGTWSRDPSTKVGVVIVMDDRVISTGYNGFPRSVADDEELLNDREAKYARTVHAEANAILNAGQRLEGAVLYTTLLPCSACASLIIQAGIAEIVYYTGYPERWRASFELGMELMLEAGMGVRGYERRDP